MTVSSSESEPTRDADTTTDGDRTSTVSRRKLARILEDGLQFGKYRVIRLIAIGGMSEVYEAEHIALDKRVALKVMRRDLAENPTARQRFLSEAVNAASLRHTNVVDVTDVGEVDELPFLVMALLDGEDLGRIYDRQGRIPIPEIIDLLLPVASAVAVGHEKGLVHRDLKPDNIFLHREGCRLIPKVLDFGVSRVMTARRITLNSSVFGTPHYMSPEQARGGPTDTRSDQYSLGVILYEGVTGRLPRDSANPIELLHSVAYDEFRPPSEYFEIPPELEVVILRAMAREPGERFGSMREFALALLPFASPPAREYWSLELSATPAHDPNLQLPQMARHPSPTSSLIRTTTTSSTVEVDEVTRHGVRQSAPALARVEPMSTDVRVSTQSGHREIVVARASMSRSLPPPPPPPRPRAITPATVIAHSRAMSELEAQLALERKRRRSLLTGGAAGIMLGLCVFGIWFWRGGPNSAAPATATQNDANDYFDVQIEAAPPHATIVVDGSTMATGQYSGRFKRDGIEHTVRVSAPGWSISNVSFRNEPPPRRFQLQPAVSESDAVAAATPQPAAKVSRSTTRRSGTSATSSLGASTTVSQSSASQLRAASSKHEAPFGERDEMPVGTRSPAAPNVTPRVTLTSDAPSSPHVAVVDPARPRVRIVDEFEPKVRVVE